MTTLIRILEALGRSRQAAGLHRISPWPYMPVTPPGTAVQRPSLPARNGPDNIALELTSSNHLMVAAQAALSAGTMTADDIAALVRENVSPEFVAADGETSGGSG